MLLLTGCSVDVSRPESPRQALHPLTARLFPEKAVLPARFAPAAVAELWQIVVEPRTKDKLLLTS